jgi:GT2 family glycosyltransferase
LNPYLVIAIYDHGDTIGKVVEALAAYRLPCIIVDDGSGPATRTELGRLASAHPWVELARHPRNLGRGAALRTAFRVASRRGASHVLHLDADGQHDVRDVPRFLEVAKARPDALVLGAPIFDSSAPWHRLHGRKLSQAIVWLQTLSFEVQDPLCGYRCVPLASAMRLLDRTRSGDRMDFEPEFVIRMVRAGVPVVNVPTAVCYPEGGISHFRIVIDNLLIAWAYLRLAFEPLWRRGRIRDDDEAPS